MPDRIKSNFELREAIIRMIVFFDLFDHPLTAYEIQKKIGEQRELLEIINVLDQEQSKESPVLCQKNGFYFLSGREELVSVRQKRHNYSATKIKIACRYVKIFSLLPFVEMISLANSLGQHNLRVESDLDFFIVSSPRRVWLTRLYCTGLARIFKKRPTAVTKKNKICLSFYVAADHLCLDDLLLPGGDPYFDYWRQSLVLLYNKNNCYERFLKANGLISLKAEKFNGAANKSNIILDRLEIFAKKFQLAIMPVDLKSQMNKSDGVVINDSILKLYRRDRRREYAQRYEKKISTILAENN